MVDVEKCERGRWASAARGELRREAGRDEDEGEEVSASSRSSGRRGSGLEKFVAGVLVPEVL